MLLKKFNANWRKINKVLKDHCYFDKPKNPAEKRDFNFLRKSILKPQDA